MSMSDPTADFLTRIRNAQKAKLSTTTVLHSNMNETLCEVLKKENFISGFEVKTPDDKKPMKKEIEITLRYSSSMVPLIQEIKRLSKPGRRKYANAEEIQAEMKTFATTIVSTSKGIMTDRDAVSQKVGGELVCQLS
jgi:small subunit ribosomal protein S8